jgi:hypothetical protein
MKQRSSHILLVLILLAATTVRTNWSPELISVAFTTLVHYCLHLYITGVCLRCGLVARWEIELNQGGYLIYSRTEGSYICYSVHPGIYVIISTYAANQTSRQGHSELTKHETSLWGHYIVDEKATALMTHPSSPWSPHPKINVAGPRSPMWLSKPKHQWFCPTFSDSLVWKINWDKPNP